MRKDLNKLLCERERRGSSRSFKEVRNIKKFNPRSSDDEWENLPARESIKRRYDWYWDETKEFSENLNPLYGAVRKAVGTKWDDFYSELSKTFDFRSVINDHILLHLYHYIQIKTYVDEDGDVAFHDTYRGSQKIKDSYEQYYVDPRNGFITRNPQKTYKRTRKERELQRAEALKEVCIFTAPNEVMHKVDGTWFVYKLARIPKPEIVYTKPATNEDGLINVTPRYLRSIRKEHTFKKWEDLNEAEKKTFGTQVIKNKKYDVFTKEEVWEKPTVNARFFAEHGRGAIAVYQKNMYHVSGGTASKKLLKKHGLVNA